MYHNLRKVFIVCALIAASQSYVLPNEKEFRQQLANEQFYIDAMQQNQDVYREVRSTLIEEYEPNQGEVINAFKREKRQDRGSVSATVERNRQAGTNLNLEAQARLWQSQNRRSTLDGTANYQRNYGGQFGTGRPNYGVGLNFVHRF